MVYLEIVLALVGSNVDIGRSAVGVFKMYRFNMSEDQLVGSGYVLFYIV